MATDAEREVLASQAEYDAETGERYFGDDPRHSAYVAPEKPKARKTAATKKGGK